MSSIGRIAARLLVACLALACISLQAAAEPIGEATAAKNNVTGELGTVSQKILVGSNVSSDETVRTGTSSSTELRFLDTSTLNIGATSVVVLDRHIYDPNRGSVDTFINLSKGAMRFVSAGPRTRNATFGTPVATVGIRGTEIGFVCDLIPTCAYVMKSGKARICPYREGTRLTPELREACIDGNTARLPCAYYDIAAEGEQDDDEQGNFILVGKNCSVTPPQNVDPSSFEFLKQQIASGGPLPDPALLATTFAFVPIVPPVAAITAVGAAAIGLPIILDEPACVSGRGPAACR